MLPFFAAGGAISGSSFGLFYTILMQVGYNYYGKRALKQMNEGRLLKDVLFDIQKEIQPFSDQMMQLAIDSLPDTLDRTLTILNDMITKVGGGVLEGLLGPLADLLKGETVDGTTTITPAPIPEPGPITEQPTFIPPSEPVPPPLGTVASPKNINEGGDPHKEVVFLDVTVPNYVFQYVQSQLGLTSSLEKYFRLLYPESGLIIDKMVHLKSDVHGRHYRFVYHF